MNAPYLLDPNWNQSLNEQGELVVRLIYISTKIKAIIHPGFLAILVIFVWTVGLAGGKKAPGFVVAIRNPSPLFSLF